MYYYTNKKVIFFGDSLTQAGIQPGGYIALMKGMLAKQGITGLELVGAGIGGQRDRADVELGARLVDLARGLPAEVRTDHRPRNARVRHHAVGDAVAEFDDH